MAALEYIYIFAHLCLLANLLNQKCAYLTAFHCNQQMGPFNWNNFMWLFRGMGGEGQAIGLLIHHSSKWPSVQNQEGVAISPLVRLRCSWGLCLLWLLQRAKWNRSTVWEGNALLNRRTFPPPATENHKPHFKVGNTESQRGEMFYPVPHSGLEWQHCG